MPTEKTRSRWGVPGNVRKCKARRCEQRAETRGYCPRHYQQLRRYGHLIPPDREYGKRGLYCGVADCGGLQRAKGCCYRHYQQLRRHGRLTPETERVYGRTGCKAVGCKGKHSAKGYCKQHYRAHYHKLRLENKNLAAFVLPNPFRRAC